MTVDVFIMITKNYFIESGVLGLRVQYTGLGVRRLQTPTHDPHGLLLYALQ